jgi:hypothetical protein
MKGMLMPTTGTISAENALSTLDTTSVIIGTSTT